MKKLALILAAVLMSVHGVCLSKVVCDEAGWNKFGTWSDCLKHHYEPGAPEGRRPVDERQIGQVEKIHKNLDGSVTVWRHGSSDTEVWAQVDKDTWERKH